MVSLISLMRKLFKLCPNCGTPLINETRLEYVPAYGVDPPYKGTFQIRTLTCSRCSYRVQKVKEVACT